MRCNKRKDSRLGIWDFRFGIASIWDLGFQILDLLKDYFQIYNRERKVEGRGLKCQPRRWPEKRPV